ncbi:uncharacterized protein HMPREF1541_05814 [Cyphellophora europaea CBS 101466]|uniref:Methyltransferase type 11 domain-containing protein n=1 Tax=Cyphellophora europaea (strain CBS 101466) TaxID=1220924 RepID=W2RUZ7_CYPE1|nr:uncharacterized protein HMPREF1541_05814 [Cyphellophora europaea CBS 101466]ETN39588.1 hypothetical protein HMPREF1541_05814 [Cyphellophora europaea CBS 101466]
MPEVGRKQRSPNLPPRLVPELQALASHTSKPYQHAPPPSVSTISSPSTRFTESPAPWSAGTATTTPVSWSSASPALTSSYGMRTPEKKSKTVPVPNPPRSRLPKLPSIPRPPPPPQSGASAVVENETRSTESRGPSRKKSILHSPPPTPPPRTSSVKRPSTGGRSTNTSIDDTLSRAAPSGPPTRPSTAPSSADRHGSPRAPQLRREDRIDDFSAFTTHENLQDSIRNVPTRPSRSGTFDLGDSRPTTVNTHKAAFSAQHRQLLESGFEDVTPHRVVVSSSTAQSDTERGLAGEKRARSPARLGKFSKLRIFGQRSISSTDADKSPKKLQRRGPSAGTGHEGYGKYAKRGRKQSTEPSGTSSESERSQSSTRRLPLFSHSRKASSSSRRTSQSDLDEFAVPRLNPVVLRGGSQTSVATDNPSSDRGYLTSPDLRETTPSPAPDDPPCHYDRRVRSPLSNATNSPGRDGPVPRLALRRSQRFPTGSEPLRLPAPIRTDDLQAQPGINSYDTSLSSTMPSSAALSLPASEHVYIDPGLLKEKKARRRWWNPFRARPQGMIVQEPIMMPSSEPEMAVSIATGPAPRSIPYYAMLESESEGTGPQQIGEYMSEAANPSYSPSPEEHEDRAKASRNTESILLPAPPIWSSVDQSMQQVEPLEPSPLEAGPRQPRLAQVGRIPKVVSRSERQHKPSRQSFSQPFARGHPLQHPAGYSHDPRLSWEEPPQLQIHTETLPSRPFFEVGNPSAKPSSAPAHSRPAQVSLPEPFTSDLVKVSSMHSSDVSTSSSSAGMISVMGPGIIPTTYEMQAQSYMPVVRQPSVYAEEDVWNEFDDIIDHVMSPSRSPGSKSPETQAKQPLRPLVETSSCSPLTGRPVIRPTSRGKMPFPEGRRAMTDLPLATRGTPPVIFPLPLLTADKSVSEEIRLRRSRIVSALHSSYDPSSPFSMREFLKDYSEPRDSMRLSERLSASTAARSTLTAPALVEEPEAERTHQDNAILLDVAGRAKDPAKQSELHYASLEVSRWLSFGRVLFSPAQDEIQTLPDRNVLVIDGLGNEDWSIYCAVTYEAVKAVVYDLKETSQYKKSGSPQSLGHLPTNHRRAEIATFSERFPFQSAFFSVIVLRFPPAMSEAKLKNIISECRRSLMPGGHIEVMLLDFDFVNMGVQTRRAVRELKMRMATKDPNVNLKPTIDSFQSLLGGRGFTGLSRCVVGVPVVGRPPGSTDSSTSSRSSGGSYARRPGDPTRLTSRHSQRGQNFSLSELVADPSESADAQIGRMVSKTARNWWQHCYEAGVIPNGDLSRSIFSEKKVLQECKMRASSFKLLIAHAQRPVFEQRRRTMSESAAAAMATAGAARRPNAA